MVEIQNSAILDNISDDVKESNIALLPKNLSNNIQPVLTVNPRGKTVLYRATSATTGSTAVLTTPTDKDFYLLGFMLSYTKNGTCDSTGLNLQVTPKEQNVNTVIAELLAQTTTAGNDHVEIMFHEPILLARGSQVIMTGTFTAGAMTKRAMVYGKHLDVLKKR